MQVYKKSKVHKQFPNRVAKNTKMVQGKMFLPSNKYDLFYLKK